MKKRTALDVLGGNAAAAGRAIGITRQAVRKWPVDEFGNLTNRDHCNAVLAALVRINYSHLDADGLPDGLREHFDAETLADLVSVPTDDDAPLHTLPEDAIHIV